MNKKRLEVKELAEELDLFDDITKNTNRTTKLQEGRLKMERLDEFIGVREEDALSDFEKLLRTTKVTFSDNMDEPIHRWFRFPAGFSAKLAEAFLTFFNKKQGIVMDPFTGCGTTNVVAKTLGMNSIGIERHPLLAWIANVKTRYYDLEKLRISCCDFLTKVKEVITANETIKGIKLPELLYKCYSLKTLNQLYNVKSFIEEGDFKFSDEFRDFFILALVCILRKVTDVDVGWPYILPRKKGKRQALSVYEALQQQVKQMSEDLNKIKYKPHVYSKIYEADAREISFLDDDSIDVAFTSPPYLNNYDYADRTRLELYFLGWAKSWREITEKVRSKLIVSCSHQAKEIGLKEGILPDEEIEPSVRDSLIEKSEKLRKIKYERGGKKDYDIMIIAYFNDMLKTLREVCRVLKDKAYYGMVLGDSAPYGVHIPTDEYLMKIGKHVGFSDAKIIVLRKRGEKWSYVAESGRRHNQVLRESLIIFQK